MKINYTLGRLAMAALLLGGTAARAQSVIFPQEQQPGTAVLTEAEGSYTLANDLFEATFVCDDGRLTFGGCPQMNLTGGTELFKIRLQNGTEVPASEMTLTDVRTVTLVGDADAVKGAERFDGKALEASYTYGSLDIVWRAVLRNGSHYLRTELDITANAATQMNSITPMLYDVRNADGDTAPVVVGNTRGAVIANNRIFAGLETPMGINTAGSQTDIERFVYDAWTPESFVWSPADATPQAILDAGFATTDIVAARGYLAFRESGEYTVTFSYAAGTHRLNIAGVDLVSDDAVIASDYHTGYTGNLASGNTYRLNVEEPGIYMVRYFCETKTETITSSGTISYDRKVAVPVIVFDKASTTSAVAPRRAANGIKALPAGTTLGQDEHIVDTWKPADWTTPDEVPARITELGYGQVRVSTTPLTITASRGTLTAEFVYRTGNNGLSIVGTDLLDDEGNVVVSDYHKGFSGNLKTDNVYTMGVPFPGHFTLRYFCENQTEANTSTGEVNLRIAVVDTLHLPAPETTPIQGVWSRNTTLGAGKTWSVGAVVGMMAEDQPRRSFLAYSERERAVPWRPYPVYISWYELNIDRNNSQDYSGNMTVAQCTDVVNQWKTQLFDKYGTSVKAFVWDDGWDEYGTWGFNPNFPNGFSEPNEAAIAQGSGIGAWLGPVGGYGTSGNYRRAYWNGKGGMQLSNPDYYNTFLSACSNMIDNYDFRFFKFDGISAQFSSVGPDAGTTGEENAEGIIDIERRIREKKADIFLNTTVGTWASPFWFQFTDAVWRQENDYGTIGNQGSDRERWITYRDRLVYQNYVQNSPLCPINTLMTHGFILSSFGAVSKDMDYDGIVREMRCAFACGSGMVELYNDYKLMNSINNGALWSDLADCIRWQEKNADVLPDVHWVGGNPWDGSRANVYGWASWNGQKATLALRNPAASQQTYRTTLRQALEIPAYVRTSITLTDAFSQPALSGIPVGQPIDIDTELTITLPASSVFVYDGADKTISTAVEAVPAETSGRVAPVYYDLGGRRVARPTQGISIGHGRKVMTK